MLFTYEVATTGFHASMDDKLVVTIEAVGPREALAATSTWVSNLCRSLEGTDATLVVCGPEADMVQVEVRHAIHASVERNGHGEIVLKTNEAGGTLAARVFVDLSDYTVHNFHPWLQPDGSR